MPVDNNFPPISQCPTCDAYVYQAIRNNGTDNAPNWVYVLAEVTHVDPGESTWVLRRDASHDGYPIVEEAAPFTGTAILHPHQEFN